MNKIVNGKTIPLTQLEIEQRTKDEQEAQLEQTQQEESKRVSDIWKQIEEQEKLSIRAVLNNDTVWIEKRKANILALKEKL